MLIINKGRNSFGHFIACHCIQAGEPDNQAGRASNLSFYGPLDVSVQESWSLYASLV